MNSNKCFQINVLLISLHVFQVNKNYTFLLRANVPLSLQNSAPKQHLNPPVRHNLVKVATSKLQQTEEADVSSCVL